MISIKVVTVGDGGIGKTSMLISYTTNTMPGDYIPTVFDNYSCNLMLDEKLWNLALWDTAGQEEYDRIRSLSYNQADVVLIAYSVSSSNSFENIRRRWFPEVTHWAPGVPTVLVGTQVDVRKNKKLVKKLKKRGERIVSKEEGCQIAREIGASYVECSAKTQEGLGEVFNQVIRTYVEHKRNSSKKKKKNNKCTIL